MNHSRIGALLGVSAALWTTVAITIAIALGFEDERRMYIAHGLEDDMFHSLLFAGVPLGFAIGWSLGVFASTGRTSRSCCTMRTLTPAMAPRPWIRSALIIALLLAALSIFVPAWLAPYAIAISTLHALAFADITAEPRDDDFPRAELR